MHTLSSAAMASGSRGVQIIPSSDEAVAVGRALKHALSVLASYSSRAGLSQAAQRNVTQAARICTTLQVRLLSDVRGCCCPLDAVPRLHELRRSPVHLHTKFQVRLT